MGFIFHFWEWKISDDTKTSGRDFFSERRTPDIVILYYKDI